MCSYTGVEESVTFDQILQEHRPPGLSGLQTVALMKTCNFRHVRVGLSKETCNFGCCLSAISKVFVVVLVLTSNERENLF